MAEEVAKSKSLIVARMALHAFHNQGTRSRASDIISAVFRYLARLLGLTANRTLRKPPRRQFSDSAYHLTNSEVHRLLASCRSLRDRAMIALFVDTGIRRAELANLRIEDIQLEKRLGFIRHGKGGKHRIVPLSNAAAQAVAEHIGNRSVGYVFQGRFGGSLTTRQINRIVAETGARAGLKHPNPARGPITCHLLRHTFSRHWKDAGGDIETLAKILGHSSVATTWDLYGTQGLADVVRNFNQVINSTSSSPSQTFKRGGK